MTESSHELDEETIRDLEDEIRLCQAEVDRAETALKCLGLLIESKIAFGESVVREKAKFIKIRRSAWDLMAIISAAKTALG